MDKKAQSNYMLPKETHFGSKDTNRLNVNKWKNIFHANSNQQRELCGTTKIRQNRLQVKNCYQRQRTICIDKRINSLRRYNDYKHICTKQSPKITEANIDRTGEIVL